MPLARRIPKRGFTNDFKKIFQIVNLGSLNKFKEDAVVSREELLKENLIKDPNGAIKILGDGDISKPLTIKAHSFSKSALEKIKNAGGKIEILQE